MSAPVHGPVTWRSFEPERQDEAFTKQDPFILEGLVSSFAIRDWNDCAKLYGGNFSPTDGSE